MREGGEICTSLHRTAEVSVSCGPRQGLARLRLGWLKAELPEYERVQAADSGSHGDARTHRVCRQHGRRASCGGPVAALAAPRDLDCQIDCNQVGAADVSSSGSDGQSGGTSAFPVSYRDLAREDPVFVAVER